MLDDAIERSQQIFTPLGAVWNEQKKTWKFPAGGRLRFRPLERVADAEKYQGQNISDACVEEAGNYADPAPIDRLFGVLRSAKGVPTQLLLTGNPGGPGQLWIKHRYVDPAPMGMKILTRHLPNGAEHRYVFIPSRLDNNLILLKNDPSTSITSIWSVRPSWSEHGWRAIGRPLPAPTSIAGASRSTSLRRSNYRAIGLDSWRWLGLCQAVLGRLVCRKRW